MEIFRRMGLAGQVRAAGMNENVPMDVSIVTRMTEPPLLHLDYPSVAEARAGIEPWRTRRSPPTVPADLAIHARAAVEEGGQELPSVRVMYGTEFEDFSQDAAGVTTTVRTAGGTETIRSRYMVGCDGGSSRVRKALNIHLRGEGDIMRCARRCTAATRCSTASRWGRGRATGGITTWRTGSLPSSSCRIPPALDPSRPG